MIKDRKTGDLQQPELPRRTSTRLRRTRARRPGNVVLLILLAFLAALGGYLALHTAAGGSGSDARPNCDPTSCQGLEDVRAQALPPTEAAPCAYCGQDPNRWRQSTDKAPPEINGKAAAIIEASCGTLLYGINENAHLAPASLTKMVTAMVTLDKAKLSDMVDIKVNGWDLAAEDGSSIMGIEAGMRLSVQDLMYGMLLVSGNDAAIALADYLGGNQRTVEQMNAKVRQLGLANTQFTTPDGRDSPGQHSSALDMALIGRALLQNPTLNTIVNTKTYAPNWDGRTLSNTNEMIWAYDDAIGVKIGYTETADFTIVTGIQRGGRLLIASVLGSQVAYVDPVRLLNWAFANTKPACPT